MQRAKRRQKINGTKAKSTLYRNMKIFKSERDKRLANSILLLVFGILMMSFSGLAAAIFAYTCGAFFLAIGVFFLFCFFLGFHFFDPLILLQGVLNVIIGILAVANPDAFMTWVFYVVAIFLAYQGILETAYSIDLKLLNNKTWWLNLAYGVLMIALSITTIVLDLTKGVGSNILMIAGGAMLALAGLVELIFIIFLHRNFKRKRDNHDNDHDDKVVAEQ